MCDNVILENRGMIMFISRNLYKAVDNYLHVLELVPVAIRLKKCVIKLLIPIFLQYNLP